MKDGAKKTSCALCVVGPRLPFTFIHLPRVGPGLIVMIIIIIHREPRRTARRTPSGPEMVWRSAAPQASMADGAAGVEREFCIKVCLGTLEVVKGDLKIPPLLSPTLANTAVIRSNQIKPRVVSYGCSSDIDTMPLRYDFFLNGSQDLLTGWKLKKGFLRGKRVFCKIVSCYEHLQVGPCQVCRLAS